MKSKFNMKSIIIAAFLSVLLIVLSCFSTVSAVSAAKQNLSNAIDDYYGYISVLGRPFSTSEASNTRLNDAYNAAREAFHSKTATDEEMQEKADNLLYALDNMYIDSKWAKETYTLCLEESNESGLYSDELWLMFETELEELNSALTSMDEKRINEEYYKVIDIYNEMCFSYSAIGDVDGNGIVNIADVTLIQKYLSGDATLCGVQLYAGSVNCSSNEISVNSATCLQKHLSDDSYSINTDNVSNGYNLIITPYTGATGKRMQTYRSLIN